MLRAERAAVIRIAVWERFGRDAWGADWGLELVFSMMA